MNNQMKKEDYMAIFVVFVGLGFGAFLLISLFIWMITHFGWFLFIG